MKKMYCCNEIAKIAGLKSGRMVSEFAFKHFGKEEIFFSTTGFGGQKRKNYKLTEEQLKFFLSRSRSNTANVINHFCLNSDEICLMRNEVLFVSIVKGLLDITNINYKTQHKIHIGDSYALVDMFVYGDFGCAIIEYDERQHGSSKNKDKIRDRLMVCDLIKNKGFRRVKIIRVKDNSASFSSSMFKINKLIHSDFFHPVEYIF